MSKRFRYVTFILIHSLSFHFSFAKSQDTQDSAPSRIKALTLQSAFDLAIKSNPELAASWREFKAMEAEVWQTKLLANPELGFEAENLGARGQFRKEETLEFTTRLSQVLEFGEWGNKVRLAVAEKEIAREEYEYKRLHVLTEVSRAFIEALFAGERFKLNQGLLAMAEEVTKTIDERVKAGKSPALDILKARVEYSLSRVDLDRSEIEVKVAKRNLSKVCGGTSMDSVILEGNGFEDAPIPEWHSIENRLSEYPDMERGAQVRNRQAAVLGLEKGKRIPSLTLAAGFRQSPDLPGHAFIAEISLPLPVWNWNQGSVAAARHRYQRSVEEQKAATIELSSKLFETHSLLGACHREIGLLKGDAIPAAEAAYRAAEEGYRAGKFTHLELLEARRSLSETRSHYLNALKTYQILSLDLQRLMGVNPISLGSKP